MKRYGMSLCALACFTALTLPCVAQDNSPWNGSWKIDRSTLKYDGPTVSIATDADGYTVTRDGKASPKVTCNGQPNAPVNGTVTTCTKVGTGYAVENTRDGKTVNKVKVEISPDGNKSTRTVDIMPPDGDPYTITMVSKKVSGGNGAPTVWKETGFTESQDTGTLSVQVNGDSVDFKETDNNKPITCKLDGTPVKFGRGTISVKQDGPRTLKVTYSDAEGKVGRENTFVLSPNGKMVTETDVTPAPSASTMSVKFHKAA
ncbi:MAG TPA: hypothetical protein VE109_07800 [Acidobacteriaceae bacterium]|nr:hypothetical protein [Acidobacteriaceae bacterium]